MERRGDPRAARSWPVPCDKASATGQDGTVSWTLLIPVKRLEIAKTRLRGILSDSEHDRLVVAMAMDVAAAALASPVAGRVVVVTADSLVAKEAAGLGAQVISDVPDAGLNPALAYAAHQVRPPGVAAYLPGVAALAADLPALRPEELTSALRAAETVARSSLPADADRSGAGRAFVADAAGTGTVLLAALPGMRLEPCFGAGSASAHVASGAVAVAGDWPGLRRDVDTPADLAEAIALGVGRRTAEALADAALPDAALPDAALPGAALRDGRDDPSRGTATVAGG